MEYTLAPLRLPTYYRLAAEFEENVYYSRSVMHRLSSDRITALHYHAALELGYCLDGRGITYVGDRIYRYQTGDLQWVRPYQPHLSASDPGTESRWIWISVDTLQLFLQAQIGNAEALVGLFKNGYSGVFHPEEYPRLSRLMVDFDAATQAGENDTLGNAHRAFLLGEMLWETAKIGAEQEEENAIAGFGRILPAVRYISEHYAEKEAVREEKIAALLGVCPSYLRVLFRKETGMSLRTFLLRTRLAAAAHLLMETSEGILDIALETGFEEASYFTRAFRNCYGMPPARYRREKRH